MGIASLLILVGEINDNSCERDFCANDCQTIKKVEQFNKGYEMSKEATDYTFKATEVVKVIDGDTLRFKLSLGFRMECVQTFRLRNIDTPEIYRPRNDAELKHGQEARDFIVKLFDGADEILVHSHKTGLYGRWEADVTVTKDGSVHDLVELLKNGGFEKQDNY